MTNNCLRIAILTLVSAAVTPALPAQTSVTGVGYTQFVYQLKDTANHANGFDVTRAYINVLGRFAGGVTTRITADVYRQAGDASLRYRLKYAFIGYTPQQSSLTVKLGQLQTPWIDFEEALWDYRMQGTVALDRTGYLSSSDFGLAVDGKWGPDRVNASIALINGEGYNGGTGDQRKDAAGRLSIRLRSTDDSSRVGGLRLSGYAHVGKPTSGGTRRRFAGMASYRTSRITVAAEYAVATDSVTAPATPETHGRVITVFAVYRAPSARLGVIARYDAVDPEIRTAANRVERVITGVSYQLTPNVRVLADWDHVMYEGTPTAVQAAARSQAAFRAQFAF